MPRSRNSSHDADYHWIVCRLAELRTERGVSQDFVAKALKTSQSMISKMEKGIVRVDLADLLAFLASIEVDPLEFVAEYLRVKRKR